MAKILLIKCSNLTRMHYYVTPPLGIMYLASALTQQGHEVRILDTRLKKHKAKLKEVIQWFSPDIVGLSAITMEAESMHRIAREIKKINSQILIIAGGPHPTSYYNDVLSDKNIDLVVVGEGEKTIVDIAAKTTSDIHNIEGMQKFRKILESLRVDK